MTLHPLFAAYPHIPPPQARVDAHVLDGGEVPAVHLTRYPVLDRIPPEWEEPSGLRLHLAVMDERLWRHYAPRPPRGEPETGHGGLREEWEDAGRDRLRFMQSASVLASRAEPPEPPELRVDTLLATHPAARAVGVVVDRGTAVVGLRTRSPGLGDEGAGYTVTMQAAEPRDAGPVELYASALWAWALWWTDRAQELSDRDRVLGEVPPPPLELDVVEAWTPHRVRLERPARTEWSSSPSSSPSPGDEEP
ncbi:hypothetical protein [Streptomyces spirodelae]|uniref:Uncharacterized protein n=1 Tax=Streptomyces spirodelae TaxID=2812904 RepID=A0ABS3X1J6_9ACTN|nr:hypothetical protein [Streptomyces spirodelae]MBO8189242.1 hypothetical protein [Streptomyces spirodelae]